MKVYGVYTTDQWQSRNSKIYVGFYSTIDLARDAAVASLEENVHACIEEIIIDEPDSGVKFEVYENEAGLTWKSEVSDAEIDSMSKTLRSINILRIIYQDMYLDFDGNENESACYGQVKDFYVDDQGAMCMILRTEEGSDRHLNWVEVEGQSFENEGRS